VTLQGISAKPAITTSDRRPRRGGTRSARLLVAGIVAVAISTLLAGPASADPPVPTGFATLGGRVWADGNANGIQDPGEPGVAGVTVIVDWGLGPAYRVTDAEGRYSVDNVAAGRPATVFFSAPDGQVFSPQAAPGSTSITDSDPNESGTVPPAAYLDGTVRLDIDAGIHAVGAPTTTSTTAPATSTVPATEPVPTVPATPTTAPSVPPTTAGPTPTAPATTVPITAPQGATPTTGAPVVAGIAITAPVATSDPATAVLGTSTDRSPELARTGSDGWRSALPAALLLLGLGCLLLGTSRRLTRAR